MEGARPGHARRWRRVSPAAARPLEPRRIDLWCASLEAVDTAHRWGEYRALLDAGERARQRRLRLSADRRRDLLARALARTVLSRYAPVAPQAWVFGADEHGRPRIVAPEPVPPIEFNITHSGQLVALAIATGRPLGLDAEDAQRRTDTVALERYFAPGERTVLGALPAQARRRRFFELWTLKESYLKARGVGLRLPLRGCAFEFAEPDGLRLGFTGAFEDEAERWAFAQLTLRGRYVLAVCAGRRGSEPLALAVHETVPLAWQRPVYPIITRATGIAAVRNTTGATLGG